MVLSALMVSSIGIQTNFANLLNPNKLDTLKPRKISRLFYLCITEDIILTCVMRVSVNPFDGTKLNGLLTHFNNL